MIQTVVSQQPGCVVDPSYVMKWSVLGRRLFRHRCFIGCESPGSGRGELTFLCAPRTFRRTETSYVNLTWCIILRDGFHECRPGFTSRVERPAVGIPPLFPHSFCPGQMGAICLQLYVYMFGGRFFPGTGRQGGDGTVKDEEKRGPFVPPEKRTRFIFWCIPFCTCHLWWRMAVYFHCSEWNPVRFRFAFAAECLQYLRPDGTKYLHAQCAHCFRSKACQIATDEGANKRTERERRRKWTGHEDGRYVNG